MQTLVDIVKPTGPDGSFNPDDLDTMRRRLASAYRAVFTGNGSHDDADLVLVDLAQFSRYLDTAPIDASAEVAKAFDSRRAVFLRIIEWVVTAGGDVDGLHRAALRTPSLEEE